MNLNYRFVGNPNSNTLIIFLHEGLGSIAQWKSFPEKLCHETNSYGLIYDRAGYGESTGNLKNRKTDYLHLAADELANLMNWIPDHYKTILYGHSDGGSIALIYTANYPNRINAIITEAAHVFVEDKTLEGVTAAQIPFKNGLFNGLKKYHGMRFEEVFNAWNKTWLLPEFRLWNIENLLPKILCPQLIIQGKDDQYGTLKQVESIAKHTTGESTLLVLDNCGHAPHKENEIKTLLTVKEFINDLN